MKQDNKGNGGGQRFRILIAAVVILAALYFIGIPLFRGSAGLNRTSEEVYASSGIPFSSSLISIATMIGLPLAVLGIVWIWYYSKQKKKEYDEQIIGHTLAEMLPNAVFQRGERIAPSPLEDVGILPRYDREKGDALISYRYNGQPCRFSNVHLVSVTRDDQGYEHHHTLYRGQIYTMPYKTALSGSVRLFSTATIGIINKEIVLGYRKQQAGETKIETENVRFNDSFDVYATDGASVFYVLTPLVMERLLELKQYYGRIGAVVCGNEVIVALETDRLLFAQTVYDPKKELELRQKVRAEIGIMLQTTATLDAAINGRIG